MSERESFLASLHSTPSLWERIRFGPEWTSEQIDALLRPHAKGFNFRIVREEFDDGVAFTIRSADYYEVPLHASSFTTPDNAPRELSQFLHCYIGWLRWAADEIEKTNSEFIRSNPHPNLQRRGKPHAEGSNPLSVD